MLEWAMFYADEWSASVIPLREGKHPAVYWTEFQKTKPVPGQLASWFGGESPAWGMALVCGAVSGNLVRLDFDDPADYAKLMPFLVGLTAKEAPTFRSQREGGGYGVVFRNKWTVRKVPGGGFEGYPKLELMGEGCITVVPPTPGYGWIDDNLMLPTIDLPRMFLGHDLWRRSEAEGTPLDDEIMDLLENTTRGGRDDALLRLVSMFRARNVGLEVIKRLVTPYVLDWEHGDEPWDEATIEGKIEDMHGRYSHEGSRYGGGSGAGLHLPGSNLAPEEFERTVFDPAVGRKGRRAPERHLVDRLVMGGDQANVAMAAFTGIGKTTLCLTVAVCMAQGRPVWGVLDVPRPLRVMFVDQEEVLDQIEETLGKLSAAYGRPAEGQMLVLSGKGRPYSVTDPETMDSLHADIEAFRPDFLFIDGWQWFVGGRVNDKEIVNPALGWLRGIRSRFGCGTWVIHHTKKIGAPANRPDDALELASGAQELMNQARTKLIYEHMRGEYEDFGYLHGRTGRSEWNPVKVVLEYDQSTQSHRLVGREEAEDLFDQETVAEYYGELAKSRLVKGLLNELNRAGVTDREIADFLGIAKSSVSRWRSGAQGPSADRLRELGLMAAEHKSGSPRQLSDNSKTTPATSAPIEHEKMPKKAPPYICNNNRQPITDAHVTSDTGPEPETVGTPKDAKARPKKAPKILTHEGKPGPLCGRCPLRGQPHVPGRGGSKGCVMLVGDGPGQSAAKSGRAYSGRTGLRLEKALRLAKIDPNLCRYSHVVQCHVPKSRMPTKRALECCRSLLEAELAEYSPKTIISLGEAALKAFYPGKLQSYHGLRVQGDGYVLVPMYKPDAGDKQPDIMAAFVSDFAGFKGRPMMRRLEGDYRRAFEFAPASDLVAIDTETTGLALTSRIVGIGLCDTPGEAVFMTKEAGIASLKEHKPDRAVMYNAKYDLGIFETNGLPMSFFGDVEDALLLAYVMEKRPLGLKDRVLQDLNLEMSRFLDVLGERATFADVPEDEAVQYGCADPDGTLRLWNHLWKEACARERKVYLTLDKPLVSILARMELNGVAVDVKYLKRLGATVDEEMDAVAGRLEAEFGLERASLTKPKEMQDYIYRKLGLTVSELTDPDNPSTGRRILERIRHEHDAVNLILRYRELATLKNTFVTGIIDKAKDGVIHPTYNQARVVTGRLSTSEPNFQGLPSRRTSDFRRAIVAPPGHVVASFDNSQIDLRSLAHISKCPVLNDVFDRDGDIHAETSMLIYGDVEGTHRFEAKAANFMPVYGGTYVGLARRTGLSEDAAKEFLEKWYGHYRGVTAYLERLREQALRDGYVETAYGRRRHIPGLFTAKRAHALRQAQNTPSQGTSADVLKLQMIAVAPLAMPFAQIHDELDFYLPAKGAGELIEEIRSRMEGIDCPFRLKVAAKTGPNLGDLAKWEA